MHPKHALSLIALFVLLAAGLSNPAMGQCILANPSFEIGRTAGAVFGGWNQFGVVGSTTTAAHGSTAAQVSGPNTGGWDMSGFWQRLDCDEGEQWSAAGHVLNPSDNPLTGQCAALVNIEWRDAADELIAYDTFTVADAASPTDVYLPFDLVSSPAPAGTATLRFVLGVLQSPSDPSPSVLYDQVSIFSTTSPTIDEMQWSDFPGNRSLTFADRTWRVKGPGVFGPGPSNFCHLPDCVWVDDDGRLHLTIKLRYSTWYSTEVVLVEPLGYGDYVFTTRGSVDQLDTHAIFGLFLWQYGPCYDPAYLWWNPYNEIDVEIGRWGNPAREIGQFVVQPWDGSDNISRFDATFGDDELASHAFDWRPDRIEFRSWRGGPADETPENMIHAWTYTGPHIPRPEQPRVHLNLWQYDGPPAANQEVVIDDFTFTPLNGATAIANPAEMSAPEGPSARLYPAAPNPFNPATTIRFSLQREAFGEVTIHDVTGARIRTLVRERLAAGEHEATWNGRDDAGRPLASGIYLCRLHTGGATEAQRLVLIR